MAMTKNVSTIALSAAAAALLTFSGCGGGGGGGGTTSTSSESSSSTGNSSSAAAVGCSTYTVPSVNTLTGDITTCTKLTADRTWFLEGLVAVKGTELMIEAGTTIAGTNGTGANTTYLVIDKDAKILAEGTEDAPIVFTSKDAEDGKEPTVGQWGGLTVIGTAANDQVKAYEVNTEFEADDSDMEGSSGILKHVKILNSGITMEQDKEINGLSMVGVGSGTVVENITIDLSDDDGIELWGGTVNLKNLYITRCTDDYFDIDDGFSGKVENLNIVTTTGNAAIEMSGTTNATFDGFHIVQAGSKKEGALYFKKDGIAGTFKNGVIIDNVDEHHEVKDDDDNVIDADFNYGVIHSTKQADVANITFENVTIEGTATGARFTNDPEDGGVAEQIEAAFDAGLGNKNGMEVMPVTTIAGDITSDYKLTAGTTWILEGLVAVKDGATLFIEPGTTIAGTNGTGANTTYMVVDKGSRIIADGTEAAPITFTSKDAVDGAAANVGQWGGLTLIGNAGNAQVKAYEVNSEFVPGYDNLEDSSGVLRHVKILNSGITMEQDKEINGLSMVGVGSGTVVEDITVDLSDDDGIELWGGAVNLTNLYITRCTDDYFDIDDGFSGTVKNLNVTQEAGYGNAAVEMSGTTNATFDGFTIVQNGSKKEGGIYFKKDGIAGTFMNGTITDNVDEHHEVKDDDDNVIDADFNYGAIHSTKQADIANIVFENVTIDGTATGDRFTNDPEDGGVAGDIEAIFDAGEGNSRS